MSFWDTMELWEKMLLVLAAAMGLTLIAGITKVIYTRFRIKKYTRLAAARKSHLENVRNSRNVIQLKSEDIPFGIRAIEAGIEVEGVVISRPATPNSSRPNHSQLTLVGSDVDSLKSGNNGPPSPGMPQVSVARSHTPPVQQNRPPMVYQPSPYLSLPPTAYRAGSGSGSMRSNASSVTSSPPLTRVPSTEKPGINKRSLSDTLVATNLTLPSSQSEFGIPRQQLSTMSPEALTLAALEGRLPAEIRAPSYPLSGPSNGYYTPSRTPSPPEAQSLPSVGENENSEDSSRESDSSAGSSARYSRPPYTAAYSTPVIGNIHSAYRPVPEPAQGDLSLLHTHRLSHAAEVGQLLPRRRDRTSQAVSNNSSSPTSSPPSSPSAATFLIAPTDTQYALDVALTTPRLADPPVPSKTESAILKSPAEINSRFTEGPWFPRTTFDGAKENAEAGGSGSFGHAEIGMIAINAFESALSTEDQRPVTAPANGTVVMHGGEEVRKPIDKGGKRNLLKKMRLGKSKSSVDLDLEAQR